VAARSDGVSRSKGGRRAVPVLDIAALRAGLDAGKLVRVSIVPSGSFPEGATGRVRAIGDPAIDGEEFLQVEIGAGRNRDVLPFAPGDLAPYRRGGVPTPPAVSTPSVRTPPPAPSVTDLGAARRARSAESRPQPAAATGSVSRPAPQAPQPAMAQPAAPEPDTAELFPSPAPSGPRVGSGSTARSSAGRTPSRAKGKRPAVTITVSTDGESGWQVEARVGSRVAVRAVAVSPARVAEIARELDEPRLVEVVDGLLAEHRKSVQARADQLVAELAEVQAELELFPQS
jgi:hypothetical protein